MEAALGVHYTVSHSVEGGGLVMVVALVLVVSDAPLIWAADMINCVCPIRVIV
jgi:hypothetical protein